MTLFTNSMTLKPNCRTRDQFATAKFLVYIYG